MILALTPQEFAANGKEWIEAVTAVLDVLIVKLGILTVAAYGLIKIFRTQDAELRLELRKDLDAVKERQDRQGDRINQVAMAVPPVGAPGNGNGNNLPQVPAVNEEEQQ